MQDMIGEFIKPSTNLLIVKGNTGNFQVNTDFNKLLSPLVKNELNHFLGSLKELSQ